MAGHRRQHLTNLLQQKLSLLVSRELDDPHLAAVTITGVKLAKDQSSAQVTFTVFTEGADPADLERRLNGAAGFLSHALARSWPTRKTPTLQFHHDPGFDHMQQMEVLLKTVRPPEE